MSIVLITLGSLVVLALVAAVASKLTKGSNDAVQPTHGDCSTCSGEDAQCEQVCYMEAAIREVEYYDDEELDVFKHRPSDSYTDEEVQRFAAVLYTLRPQDAKGWARSLSLREVELPDVLKDDLFALIDG